MPTRDELAIARMKDSAAACGVPILYISAPTPTTERIVFADGTVCLKRSEALDKIKQAAIDSLFGQKGDGGAVPADT